MTLIREPLRTLRSEDEGQAGACPDRLRAIPSGAGDNGPRFHDPDREITPTAGPLGPAAEASHSPDDGCHTSSETPGVHVKST
jgi:hypothetical protein